VASNCRNSDCVVRRHLVTCATPDDKEDAPVPVASARDNDSDATDETLGGASLRVLVLGADADERLRLGIEIGATRGLSCCAFEDLRGDGASGTEPDVVLLVLDPQAPGADATLRGAIDAWKPAPILVWSDCDDQQASLALVRKGARGVVRKHRETDHLGTAIRKVSGGEIWLSRGGLSRLVDDMATTADTHVQPPQRSGTFATLTEREREVAALIAEGLHNRAIATRLGITENTVRHHLTAIYGKLGVADRLELAVHALRHRGGGRSRRP
jgi:DNA-binding NarL/FixJ family response regulator